MLLINMTLRARAWFARIGARCGVTWLGVSLLSATSLSAQPMASAFVGPGDRVRVTTYEMASAGERRVGVLQRVDRDSVTVTVDWTSGVRETMPLHRLSRLDVSDGRGSMVRQGMGYGLLVGAIVGAAHGSLNANDGGEYFPPAAVVTVTTIAGGLAGTVIGGLVGAVGRRERWTRVRLEQPLRRVSITPQVGPTHEGQAHVGVRVGLRF